MLARCAEQGEHGADAERCVTVIIYDTCKKQIVIREAVSVISSSDRDWSSFGLFLFVAIPHVFSDERSVWVVVSKSGRTRQPFVVNLFSDAYIDLLIN